MNKKITIFIKYFIILIVFMFIGILIFHKNEYYVSYGNGDANCNVIKVKSKLNMNSKLNQFKKDYKDYDYLKIDEVISKEKVSKDEFASIIKNSMKNQFKYGISLLDGKINLLSEEINMNNIIDYSNYSININNLNNYLNKEYTKEQIDSIKKITIFQTKSMYYENDEWILLEDNNGFHRRSIEENKKQIDSIINNSGALLASMNKEDGEYYYGYRTNSGENISGYNILRHAGSTWSLIKLYQNNPSEELENVIKNAIDNLVDNYIIKYDKETSFVIEKKADEIKLGGNALTLLMLSEYAITFKDDKYLSLSNKIANGILYMQQKDGTFNHVLNKKFKLKSKYRTVYYDGEAVYSLVRFYQVSKNKKYLEKAKKSIDMFIDKNYEEIGDHWVSYALCEYLQYNDNSKYVDLLFKNYTYNKESIDEKISFKPTKVESLLATYRAYQRLNNNDLEFSASDLLNSAEINLEMLLSYYINPEVAMYAKLPSKVSYGFHNITDDFRMRIDDIQHSLVGIIAYQELIQAKQ